MLGVFAEFETNLRRERQFEGIAKAKSAGVYKGRPPSIEASRVRELESQGCGAHGHRQGSQDRPGFGLSGARQQRRLVWQRCDTMGGTGSAASYIRRRWLLRELAAECATRAASDAHPQGYLVGAPGHREAAGWHGFYRPAPYGFHLTGVTASGVPLLELTQRDAVRLQGLGSL
jgi:hypothetical protein